MQPSTKDLKSLYLSALNALPEALFVADQAGRVILRNKAGGALGGGDEIGQILHHDHQPVLVWASDMARLGQTPCLDHRGLTVDVGDGRSMVVDIRLTKLDASASAGLPPDLVLVLVSDVSARVAIERRLLTSERLAAVGELAPKIAHELNNPLDGVLRYIGLAQRSEGPAAHAYLENARAGLMRMSEIIQDLLEQGHPKQGRFFAPVEKLLREAWLTFEPKAKSQGVAVRWEVAETSGLVDGNLFQVFCNIVKNALDAMSQGGCLTVRQECDGSRMKVEFADTGCGIMPADAEKIFEPFFTTKHPGEGTGLGLAISRQIVGRIGGTITAASRPEGGTAITLCWPIDDSARFGRQPTTPM